MDDVLILPGDVLTTTRTLPDASVHCIVTSPPYYGLRAYLPAGHADKALEIGLEPTVGAYVARLVAVFEECRRVLRDDGTLWLNLGDSYAGGGGFSAGAPSSQPDAVRARGGFGSMLDGRLVSGGIKPGNGLKPKDLIGVPWRVAFALQDAGWWLRADIIWAKTAPMPESVTDRPTRSHEHIFLLTKSARYFYDNEAVKETATGNYSDAKAMTWDERVEDGHYSSTREWQDPSKPFRKGTGDSFQMIPKNGTRNQRDVWTLGPESFSGAHFAVFPTEIPRRAILAGTSARTAAARLAARRGRGWWSGGMMEQENKEISARYQWGIVKAE